MRAVLIAVLATVVVALPSAAEAATVRVNATTGSSNRTLTVTLEGSTRASVGRNGNNLFVVAYAGDTLAQTGSACSSLDGGLDCGAESTFGRIVVNGSTGSDVIVIAPQITRATTLNGNGGDDEIAGGGGNDTIDGHNGNDVITGGAGNDTLDGSAGNDFISGDTGNDLIDGGSGTDVLSGGGQSGDTLDYAGRGNRVTVDLNRVKPQGEAGENDEIDGFAVVLGGSGADTITGTDAAERLEGNGGGDFLAGGGGNDTLNGGSGDDALIGGAGADTLNGGDGLDAIDARDGAADAAIACGNARDLLANDAGDPTPADCEIVAPLVTGAIAVAGEARIGATLSAVFSGNVGGTESALTWHWLRCGAAGCVPAGDGATYAVTDADIGAQVVAVLRANNEAGGGELASAPLGPVPVPTPATPPPGPPAATPSTAVRSVRCSGRRCRVALTVTGTPASLRAVLTRGGRRIASVTRKTPKARFTLTIKTKRKLKSGSYRLRITAPGAKTVTRTVRVKR